MRPETRDICRWSWSDINLDWASMGSLRMRMPKAMLSATVMWLNSAYDWNTKPMRRSCTAVWVTSRSATQDATPRHPLERPHPA